MVEVKAPVRQFAGRLVLVLLLQPGLSSLLSEPAVAQRTGKADTLEARVDTLAGRRDTTRQERPSSGIDTVVTYSAADSIVYSLSNRTMYLYGKGSIKNRELGLKAEKININWVTSMLNAQGVPDTADTTGKKYRGLPVLVDGSEQYEGFEIAYNFRTKKGRISLGKTEIEKGLYYGESINKVEGDVLFVQDGKFTTCDLEHPHFFFLSPTMKVMVKDKVVARPVVMYVSDVPVFALPFGIFPSERGRRSGVIAPAYGESGRGRYLSHMGYYWAMNDYMDWSIRGDIYSKGGYTLYSDYRYAVRYAFSGALSGSYGRIVEGNPGDPGYADNRVFNMHLGHNQDFDPTTRLVVDFTFSSASYYQQTSVNLNDLLRQNILSNATLTKYWEGTPNSMTINISQDQNLRAQPGDVEVSTILPSFGFSRSQTFPFRSSTRTDLSSAKWYDLIGYSYSGQFLNTKTKTKLEGGSQVDDRGGISHSIPITMSPKVGYFNIVPFFNYTEKWYNKSIDREYNAADSTVTTNDVRGFRAVRYFNMGISLSTKLYGIFQPGIFGIKGIRHQVVPSLSYSYMPDFSKPKYRYYGTYTDANGNSVTYNHFEREVFGGAPAGEQQALSLNIGNVFEMKTTADDTSGRENKFQLLNLNAGLAYNFAADSLRFSELGLSFRTNVGDLLSIGGSSSFNLYQFAIDPQNPMFGRRVNKFLLAEEGKLAQLTNVSISIGTRLSGEKQKTTAGPVRLPSDTLGLKQRSGYIGLYDQEAPDFSIPWNLDLTWNFSQSQPDPRFISRSSTLGASLGFNLTEFWKMTASGSYDILNRVFAAPQITVYRDLHCWEMEFSWVPIGQYRNYRLTIRLKANQLQDVKITKQASATNVY